MTRPSALVLDGNVVKLRLQAERIAAKSPVHVDWVRFTVSRRHAPPPELDKLFPLVKDVDTWERVRDLASVLKTLPDCDSGAAMQAHQLAEEAAKALGREFSAGVDVLKGHDFYRHRFAITRNDVEVGWVGFGASSDSPRQQAQARTLHCNLYGAACTFADRGWRDRLADLVELRNGELTRCDLALDFFDGMRGGVQRCVDDFNAGRCNVGGKMPKANFLGDWSAHSKGARSFYFGSKEAGKQTNCYEKGDQLFGVEAGSKWLRVELRYGNKLRELPTDMLREPASFFAGASDWHAAALAEADAVVRPEPIKTTPRLAVESIKAEVVRALRWASVVAGPTMAALFRHATEEQFLSVVGTTKRPGRLGRFSDGEVARCFATLDLISPAEGFGPAFA